MDDFIFRNREGFGSRGNVSEYLATTFVRHWRLISVCLVVGVMLAAGVALMRKPYYRASAKLIIKPTVADVPVSPDERTSAVVANESDYQRTEAELHSTVAMLESPVLLREVLADNLDKLPKADEGGDSPLRYVAAIVRMPSSFRRWLHDIPEPTELDRLVAGVARDLSVSSIEKSELITISYRHPDPQWSATLVNALLDGYLSPSAGVHEESDALRFFREQRDLLAEKFRAAKGNVRAFRESAGSDLALEDPAEMRSIRVTLQAAAASTEAELAEVSSRVAALAKEMESLAETLAPTLGTEVEESPSVQLLRSRLVGLQLDRHEMLSKYTADSELVRAIDRRIGEAQRLLDAERKTTHDSHASSGTAARKLAMDLIDSRTLESALQARLDAQKAEIARIGSLLDRLDKLAAQRQDLETKLSIAEHAYFTYLRKEEEARFSGALQESNIANLAIAERATVPKVPEPSRTLLILLFGTLMSGAVGFGAAFLFDYRDQSVKTISEVETVSGLPVIGLIPPDRPGPEHEGFQEPPRLLPAS